MGHFRLFRLNWIAASDFMSPSGMVETPPSADGARSAKWSALRPQAFRGSGRTSDPNAQSVRTHRLAAAGRSVGRRLSDQRGDGTIVLKSGSLIQWPVAVWEDYNKKTLVQEIDQSTADGPKDCELVRIRGVQMERVSPISSFLDLNQFDSREFFLQFREQITLDFADSNPLLLLCHNEINFSTEATSSAAFRTASLAIRDDTISCS